MKDAKKILVVDDEPDTITFLCTWLGDLGYETCSATDGAQGMQVIIDEQPDLVLMDLKMPHQTGLQLYRELQQNETLKHLPVIFITGMATTNLQFFDDECGQLPEPAARIEKPIDLKTLQAAILKAIG